MGEVEGGTIKRLFLAIDMPDSVRAEIARVQEILREQDLFTGTYVQPCMAHVTLYFLGYVDSSAVAPIKKMLHGIPFLPLKASLGKLGTFGNGDLVRVLWLDILGEGIVGLARLVERELALGAPRVSDPFQSHVTIARIKSVKNMERFHEVIKTIVVAPLSFTIDEFVLKQSVLTQEGPMYIDLERFKAGRSIH